MFIDALDVDDVIAASAGHRRLHLASRKWRCVPTEELAAIEGFDEDVASELKARAAAWLGSRERAR